MTYFKSKFEDHDCGLCLIVGRYLSWALLVFGGIVGGLPFLGLPDPSPTWDRVSAYLMALGLLILLGSFILARMMRHDDAANSR